ncbi:MAG TPA: VOC family protein [Isosphaeraceae bacterium]|jgi:catechol 2,3-dioxygenase-like lactoylglutathione lyase family enzyme|nr:VOC family protein [Isosphaeraceae bacterium]
MDWKLEVVPVPVSDVDRAKAFYSEKVGFQLDHDYQMPERRVVQLTPRGSACSIVIGTGMFKTLPGSVQGLHLVVSDIHAARAELVERGVEVSEVHDFGGGVSSVFFKDPDGNSWVVQHIAPGAHRP